MTKIRFFADHCISGSIINFLQDAGFEVYKLKDYIPKDSPDSLVILKAQELNSVLISLNGDFSDIITFPPSDYKGIIGLQLKNHPELIPQIMKRLLDYLLKYPDLNYYKSKLLLVEVHRIRIRQ